jgi:hypothetical protein
MNNLGTRKEEGVDHTVARSKNGRPCLKHASKSDATKIRRHVNSSTENSSTSYIRRIFVDQNIRRSTLNGELT